MNLKCPRCRTVNETGAKFCAWCGLRHKPGADAVFDERPVEHVCPHCAAVNAMEARFCAGCGTTLEEQDIPSAAAAVDPPHPQPLAAPAGFHLCQCAANVYFRWGSAWGGAMLTGTESITVNLFNGGCSLHSVILELTGTSVERQDIFIGRREIAELPRGHEAALEIPSYELAAPLETLTVVLVSAELVSDADFTA